MVGLVNARPLPAGQPCPPAGVGVRVMGSRHLPTLRVQRGHDVASPHDPWHIERAEALVAETS